MNGDISCFVYKSHRKNSRLLFENFYILDNTDADKASAKIAEIVESILYIRKALHQDKARLIVKFNIAYFNSKSGLREDGVIALDIQEQEYFSIEQLINQVYRCYMFINQNCQLSYRELHKKHSIRYIINRYYKGDYQ